MLPSLRLPGGVRSGSPSPLTSAYLNQALLNPQGSYDSQSPDFLSSSQGSPATQNAAVPTFANPSANVTVARPLASDQAAAACEAARKAQNDAQTATDASAVAARRCRTAAADASNAAVAATRAADAVVALKANVVGNAAAVDAAVADTDTAIDAACTAHACAASASDAAHIAAAEARAAKTAAATAADDAERHRVAAEANPGNVHTSARRASEDARSSADTAAAASAAADANAVRAAVDAAAAAAAADVAAARETKPLKVSAAQLTKYLEIKAKRSFTYQSFFVYIVFLVFFSVYMGDMYVSHLGVDGLYHTNVALQKNLMEDAMFKTIDTPKEFYAWLTATAKNFWVTEAAYNQALAASGTNASGLNHTRTLLVGVNRTKTGNGLFAERQNYPLHFMMLRQKRVQVQPCGSRSKQAAPLQAELWQRIENSCINRLYRPGPYLRKPSRRFPNVNTTHPVPYINITTDPFLTDGNKGPPLPPMRKARGRTHKHSGSAKLYSAKLPYQELFLGDVEKIVSDLKANDWIDFTTRVVVVETMVYNAVQHRYVALCYVVEFLPSGHVTTFSLAEPFWLMLLDGGGWYTFHFVCDIVSVVFVLLSGGELVWNVYLAHKLWALKEYWNPSFRTFSSLVWFVVHVCSLGFLLACLYYRFHLLRLSQKMPSDMSGTDLYEDLLAYQDVFVLAKDWSTRAFYVFILRFYEYVRDIKLLRTRVTQTIRLAARDLIIICLFSLLVTVGFAFVFNAMFGWHMAEFSTVQHAIGWLWRLAVTGELGFYYEMRDIDPLWAPIVIATYLTLTWLILLNVVLGVLAAGFEAASESVRKSKNRKKNIRENWWRNLLTRLNPIRWVPLFDLEKVWSVYQKHLGCLRSLVGNTDPDLTWSKIVKLKMDDASGKASVWGKVVSRKETEHMMEEARSLVQSFSDAEERKREDEQEEKEKLVREIVTRITGVLELRDQHEQTTKGG